MSQEDPGGLTLTFKGNCFDMFAPFSQWSQAKINGKDFIGRDMQFGVWNPTGENTTELICFKAFTEGFNKIEWTSSQFESSEEVSNIIAGVLNIENLNVNIPIGFPTMVRYSSPNDPNQWVEGDLLGFDPIAAGQPYDVQMIVKGTPSELAAYTGYLEYVYDEEEVDEMIINGFDSWQQYDDSHSVINGRATVRFATSGQIQCQTLKDADSLGTYINVG